MGFTDAAKNGMLDGNPVRQRVTDASLHTADPGVTGANEVTGGGYARVAVGLVDLDAAATGSVALNNDKAFVGPASGACGFCGFWDGTTFLGGGANTGDTTFNAAGAYNLKTGTTLHLNA